MHQLTQSAVLKALGWSLLNSLWQMAILWLVYVAFTHIFRRASASIRHGLAVLLLGFGTLWTGITFFNGFFYSDPVTSAYQLGIAIFPQVHWVSAFLQTGRQTIDAMLPYCSTLYLAVLLFLFVRYGRQYFYSRKLVRVGLSKSTPELRIFTEQTARRMGIKKEVKIWFSHLVEAPVTLGSLKPVVLMPLAAICHLNTQQVEALILHELAHIRKQDYLLNLWIAAFEVLFFFNPFSKLLIRGIQKEREHRCDDQVLQFRYDPHTYVTALMTLAGGVQNSPRLALAATGNNDQLLLQRVKRILKLHTAPEPLKSRWLLFLFFTLFITGMALSRPRPTIIQDHRMERPVMASFTPKVPEIPTPPGSAELTFITVDISTKSISPHAVAQAPRKKPVPSHEGDEDVYGDAGQDLVQLDASSSDDEEDGNLIGFASSVQTDKRDYSIVAHTTTVSPKVDVNAAEPSGPGCPLPAPAPYVPNSSFSIQCIQDSTLPGAQYVYMQQMASRQVEQAILKMQKELQWQLKILQQSSSKEIPDLKQKQQIIIDQLKLQQQYLEKQQQLQKKLEKVGKKRVIVVI